MTSNPTHGTGEATDGWARTTRDELGRVVEVATFSGSAQPPSTGTNGNWTGSLTTTYYANETTVSDQAGKARKSISDAAGRMAQVIEDPNGAAYQTTYTYDVLDDLTVVQQGVQTRTFTYDTLKRLTSATNPENGTISYTYDDNGNVTTRTDARNVVTCYGTWEGGSCSTSTGYDALNRLRKKTYSDSAPGVTYTYDDASVSNSKGRVTQISSSVSITDLKSYDAMGRIAESWQTTSGETYKMYYGYNLAVGMTSQTYPSQRTVTTSYDAAGRASSVSGSGNETYVSTISYAAHGAMQTMALGNGLTETLSYNSRLQPLSIGVGSLVSFGYDYGTTNNNGNILSQTISAPGLNVTQSYSYNDPMNRLTGISESSGWSQTYGYDRYGNRNTGWSSSQYLPLQVPAISEINNRITAANYSYDAAGNLTQWPTALGTSVYDAENKMISFNGGEATYSYDGEGRRVRKATGGTTTVFVYNAVGQMVAEYSSVTPSSGGTQYIIADHLGSTRVVMDAGGAVIARHDYLPFGEEISSGIGGRTTGMGYAADDGIRQKFTSKERDSETGLDYFLARYYSSAQGRFLSPDEFAGGPDFLFGGGESSEGALPYADITDPQSLNKYVYVYNRPLVYIDPDGHDPVAAALDPTVQSLTRQPSPPAHKQSWWSSLKKYFYAKVEGGGGIGFKAKIGPVKPEVVVKRTWEVKNSSEGNTKSEVKEAGVAVELGGYKVGLSEGTTQVQMEGNQRVDRPVKPNVTLGYQRGSFQGSNSEIGVGLSICVVLCGGIEVGIRGDQVINAIGDAFSNYVTSRIDASRLAPTGREAPHQ